MAVVKTLIGNIKGPKGEKGDKGDTGAKGNKGATGQRGSRWTQGTKITGTSTTATIFSNSGISDALVNDNYLNTSTGNTYRCTVAGNASTAKWVYSGNIKGVKGDTGAKGEKGDTGATGPKGPPGEYAAVDSVLSKTSTNPVQNKTVTEEIEKKINSDGDSKDLTTTFTSGDSANVTAWTDVGLLTSGKKHSSMFQKISTMFKNIRYLYHMLGTADISTLGEGANIGTVTGALSNLNSDLDLSGYYAYVSVFVDDTISNTKILAIPLNLPYGFSIDKYILTINTITSVGHSQFDVTKFKIKSGVDDDGRANILYTDDADYIEDLYNRKIVTVAGIYYTLTKK